MSEQLSRKRRHEAYSLQKFYLQSKRRETFCPWNFSAEVDIEALADAGFCYIGIGDACICPWCENIISNWNKGDNALLRHKEVSNSHCKYLNFMFPTQPAHEYC